MICPHCGDDHPPKTKFCIRTGKEIKIAESAPASYQAPPSAFICPHCGNEHAVGTKFCTLTGSPLDSSGTRDLSNEAQAASFSPARKQLKPEFIAAGIAILILLAGAGAYFLSEDSDISESSSKSTDSDLTPGLREVVPEAVAENDMPSGRRFLEAWLKADMGGGYNPPENIQIYGSLMAATVMFFDGSYSIFVSEHDGRQWKLIDTIGLEQIADAYAVTGFRDDKTTDEDLVRISWYLDEFDGVFDPRLLEEIRVRSLKIEEINWRSPVELKILRNIIYARHGRSFRTDWLQRYFDLQPWYERNPHYRDSLLTPVDRKNVQTTLDFERYAG